MTADLRPPAYRDRRHAGRVLTAHVRAAVDPAQTIVLALPRGGVPVAYELAVALGTPLDVLVVRKLGVPGFDELAFGAIAGGEQILNHKTIAMLGLPPEAIAATIARERAELERRERAYRPGLPPPAVAGKTAVLVDDGLATGATMQVAIAAVRSAGAARIVVAVPVGPRDTVTRLAALADEVICTLVPRELDGVGTWYDDFQQIGDAELRRLLAGEA